MKVTNEMVNDFCLAMIESEDELSGVVGDSVRNNVRTGLQAVFNAMPRQEPVAFIDMSLYPPISFPDGQLRCEIEHLDGLALYTNPQPKREPLTLDEISVITNSCEEFDILDFDEIITLVRAIEKAHGIGVEE